MSDREREKLVLHTSPNIMNSKKMHMELNSRIKSDLSHYALNHLDLPADQLIDELLNRVIALVSTNKLYKTIVGNNSTVTANQIPLPVDWKGQLVAYLLPALTMDKRQSKAKFSENR